MSSNQLKTHGPNAECGDYVVNLGKEAIIKSHVKEWVLEWCKKYHPEAWEEADKFIKSQFKPPSSSAWPRNSASLDCIEKNKKTS